MRIAITSPVYVSNNNHKDFLDKTTMSILTSHDYIWIPVENYVASHYNPLQYRFTQQPKESYVLQGRQPQGVSKAWNDGLLKAKEVNADYCLVINTDIVLKSNAIDRLVAFAMLYPQYAIWSMGQTDNLFDIENCEEDENVSEHPNFSAYLVDPKKFFGYVGKFDEHILPAYFEDNDMHGRLALNNYQAVIYGGARFFHFGSRTTNSDIDLKEEMPPLFRANQAYFISKFGSGPLGEVDEMRTRYFKHPFDDPTMDWRNADGF